MIDLKLNELPAEEQGDFADTPESELTAEQRAIRRQNRAGLSIKDTIAGDTTLSAGSRGVDTSGVSAGAGAGAGMSYVSAGEAGSPAPEITPGARSTGTTTRADNVSSQIPTVRIEPDATENLSHEDIAAHAYRCWHERGCPSGSPEIDWLRAEQELRERRRSVKTSAAGA